MSFSQFLLLVLCLTFSQSRRQGLDGWDIWVVTMQQTNKLVEMRATDLEHCFPEMLTKKKRCEGSWPAALNSN